MKCFTALQGYLRYLGIVQLSPTRGELMFTRILNGIFFTIFIEHSIATVWFLLFKAQTFREYAESFFYVSYALLVLSWYSINFIHRHKYANNFSKLDACIAMSE